MSVEILSLNLIDCEFQMFYSQKTKLRSMENLGVEIRSKVCDNIMFRANLPSFQRIFREWSKHFKKPLRHIAFEWGRVTCSQHLWRASKVVYFWVGGVIYSKNLLLNFDQKVEGRKVIYLGVRRVLYSRAS